MTAESDRQFDMEKVMRMGFTEGIERREIVKGEWRGIWEDEKGEGDSMNDGGLLQRRSKAYIIVVDIIDVGLKSSSSPE
jgi:hypothetical protein